MTEAKDAYWDDLGVAWTAIDPLPRTLAPHMKSRLRRQTTFIAIALSAAIPLGVAGLALGAWTIWHGTALGIWNFVPRGISIVAISLISEFAAWSFRAALRDNTESLASMIELSLLRTERWLTAIRLGYVIFAISFFFGVAGYEIHIHFVNPYSHALPPVGTATVTAIFAFVLYLLQRRAQERLAKYRHLKQLFHDESEVERHA